MAVPEVTITATGCRLAFARPSAVAEAAFVEMGMMDKGAVFRRRQVKGVEREPGAMQICCTPWRVKASDHRRPASVKCAY